MRGDEEYPGQSTVAIYAKSYTVEPAEGNGQQELPLPLLAKRILEVATLHAESWGVGYRTLIKSGQVWVLSRLAVEMNRYPRINEHYTLETWIEGYNKHFSSRNFAISGEDGTPCGYARTIWSVIDLNTRSSVDISQFEYIARNISDKPCPIEKQSRVRDVHDESPAVYHVAYNDIDLNRHVNSVKYIEHLLDLFPFEQYDRQRVRRFEIGYAHEARYDAILQLLKEEESPDNFALEIRDNEKIYCKGRIIFENR
ncbi:MAG TPA: acyl-[acyl-carrier-protein] thioesterase [Candidatus Barnesiella excrementigallinarum]|nr:acyl-[acyl-carrier-protein] thioesterase [Candidatus Barnesiella excrementigallinarum]